MWYHRDHRQGANAPSWTPGGRPRPAASSSRRCPARTRSSPAAPAGRSSASSRSILRDDGKHVRRERRRQALHHEAVARHDAHDLGRPQPLHRDLLHDVPGPLLHRRRLPAWTRTATTGSWAALTTWSTSPATASARPKSRARWSAIRRWPRPPWRRCRTTSRARALYAYVTLKAGIPESDELKKELAMHVRKEIGPIAVPDKIQFAPGLPKTRSGKIMRRILRKIAENARGPDRRHHDAGRPACR